MLKVTNGDWVLRLLFFSVLVSSFVMIEPAPYDFLMMLSMCLFFAFSKFTFSGDSVIAIVVLLIFAISNFVPMYVAGDVGAALKYGLVTIYLMLSWLVVAGIAPRYGTGLIQVVLNAYVLSALISVLIGILAFFQWLPGSEMFFYFGRVKSFFKDANVFGPYVVIPAVYCLYVFEHASGKKKALSFLLFLVLCTGVLLSFSRAAWGNLFLTAAIYLILTRDYPLKKRAGFLVLLGVVALPLFVYLIQTPFVDELFSGRLSLQGYDDERFSNQFDALHLGLNHLLGIGPGQTEAYLHLSAHSLYLRLFAENGIIGFLAFMVFFALSMLKAYTYSKRMTGTMKRCYTLIFAGLVGLLFNSFFVDTLHWRHFWFLLALAWVPPARQTDGKMGVQT